MNFDKTILDELSQRAKESPRLRINLDLRTTPEDQSQRMLNALEPGTVLPIHRHTKSTEVVTILRGKAVQYLYDNNGNETGQVLLEAGSECAGMAIERGQWHRIECLETGTVIFEAKDGPYEPISPEDILRDQGTVL